MQVLEEEEYLRRKEYYQESGQRHYYFMNIGNGEVIDAARKVKPSASSAAAPLVSDFLDQGHMLREACLHASGFEGLVM